MSSVASSCYPLSPEWVFNQLSLNLQSLLPECPLTVAFSGGVDSTVLLHLLTLLRDQGAVSKVQAVHVHHGLSKHADQWAEHCQSVCDQWQVPLTIVRVSLENEGYGLEQAAREARYQVFVNAVKGGGCLLQGHHRDDQAETVLLRLFRGTGVDGIQGIPEQRPLGDGVLFRPLLVVPRSSIDAWAHSHNLEFIEDDSNRDERFSRNFLRQRLIPMVEDRWPGASGRLVEFAREVGQMNQSVQQETRIQLQSCIDYRPQWLLDRQPLINSKALQELDTRSRKLVIREWLKMQGIQPPSRDTLKRIFREVVDARVDAEPQIKISDCLLLSRYQGMLVVLEAKTRLLSFAPMLWDWQKDSELRLGERSLVCYQGSAENFRAICLPEKPLLLKRRCHIPGDEKIAIAGRKGRKTLKKWLQDYKVPPWLREYLPFIYEGEQMVAAPGLWVCEGYCSRTGDGFSLHWQSCIQSCIQN
ncbi:tRNA lysidine(34) synthetase TilS [Endozoicomonas sp.]|uniref:tRNA lysidine(34) synthetase TilS n=1 Tax=Endozoicomonas sp. TaxID=1892382 RepID=UPI0028884DB7|nr:tRNA lysidine(34) synthetase TilS [Endozoicomonas sp.]